MTKFCEQCPLRGECIEQIEFGFFTGIRLKSRSNDSVTYAGAAGDKLGNVSWPIWVPADFTPADVREYIETKITFCDGPETRTTGLLRKREVVDNCAVLGSLALGLEVGLVAYNTFVNGVHEHLLAQEMHATIAPFVEEDDLDRTSD